MRRVPGEHAPNSKNRSSKHLGWFTKIKPLVRSLSNDALTTMRIDGASKELERRRKNAEKTQARKARYLEKLEAKKLGQKK